MVSNWVVIYLQTEYIGVITRLNLLHPNFQRDILEGIQQSTLKWFLLTHDLYHLLPNSTDLSRPDIQVFGKRRGLGEAKTVRKTSKTTGVPSDSCIICISLPKKMVRGDQTWTQTWTQTKNFCIEKYLSNMFLNTNWIFLAIDKGIRMFKIPVWIDPRRPRSPK